MKKHKTEIEFSIQGTNCWSPEGREAGRRKNYVREIKSYKLLAIKYMDHRYEVYSVGNIVNNYLISYMVKDLSW